MGVSDKRIIEVLDALDATKIQPLLSQLADWELTYIPINKVLLLNLNELTETKKQIVGLLKR